MMQLCDKKEHTKEHRNKLLKNTINDSYNEIILDTTSKSHKKIIRGW